MESFRKYARAIHRITRSHKQVTRGSSTCFNRRANGTNQFHIDWSLTYYKNGQCIIETGFIQFVDYLGNLFVFINEVFELKNKMRLSELIDFRFM